MNITPEPGLCQYRYDFHEKGESEALDSRIRHIENCVSIAERIYPDDPLLQLACGFHDVGRFSQYSHIGSFDDKILDHHLLGETYIRTLAKKGVIRDSRTAEILALSCRYHGLVMPDTVPGPAAEVIKKVTDIDRMEIGCVGAASDFEQIVSGDVLHFIQNHPLRNQEVLSPPVFAALRERRAFDRRICATYADSLIYTFLLAYSAVQNKADQKSANTAADLFNRTPSGEYKCSREGYADLIERYLARAYQEQEALRALQEIHI